MNNLQKALGWMLQKATGFPAWRTDNWPNGMSILGLGGETDAGVTVTGLSSLQSSAVYGCCSVLGRVVSSLPLHVIRETNKGKEHATDHWAYRLLHDSPNALMTAMDFLDALLLAFNLHGNAYAQKIRVSESGNPVSLWPLNPELMQVKFENQQLVYEYNYKGKIERLKPEDVLHVHNFSMDGIHGLTPIEQAREVIGHDLAAQKYGSSLYKNGGFLRGVVKSPKPWTKDGAERMRESWQATYGGAGNSGKTGILWDGAEYQALSMKPTDVEYLAGRRFSAAEIACLYGVPLNLLAQSDKTATYASAEQFDLQFVKYTIAPICTRFERAFNKSLFGTETGIYAKFNLTGLLRGDSASQAAFMSTMAQNGFMSRNEGRAYLDLPRSDQEGADELTVQSNLLDLNQLSKLTAGGKPAPADGGQQ